eukprot:TRINITY_DN4987_c0_g1_i1.p2 TRINITY_DN4987_c0_g1~~TRINITY_DN4987_c0_g1_i1.p2  ORF type:complete len:157 (+),score=38.33 TRINITY_DN4987_c0_g1_i1:33-503(+)
MTDDFYLRYYAGHNHGKYGHEFLEFEFHSDGKLRYANDSKYKDSTSNSRYRNTGKIRKECTVSTTVIEELKRIIEDSLILEQGDDDWPEPSSVGKQELEIVLNDTHISFRTSKIGALIEVQDSRDPEGLRIFHYLIQDLKCFVFALISIHFKIKPI